MSIYNLIYMLIKDKRARAINKGWVYDEYLCHSKEDSLSLKCGLIPSNVRKSKPKRFSLKKK